MTVYRYRGTNNSDYSKIRTLSGAKIVNKQTKAACASAGRSFSLRAAALLAAAAIIIAVILSGCNSASGFPQDYGEIDIGEVSISNAANRSGVVDLGGIHYVISYGEDRPYEIRKFFGESPSGVTVYTSYSMISCLGYYNGRLYFTKVQNGRSALCSVMEDGSDLRTESDSYDFSAVYVYGEKAYFVNNAYGRSSDSGLVGIIDLATGARAVITVVEDADIGCVLEYSGKLYIQYFMHDGGKGRLIFADADDPSSMKELTLPDEDEVCIFSIAAANGRIYASNIVFDSHDPSYHNALYSMEPDGTDIRKISDSAGSGIAVYGSYLFCTNISYGIDSLPVQRFIKTDGSDERETISTSMYNPGFAGGKLFYSDPDLRLRGWYFVNGTRGGHI